MCDQRRQQERASLGGVEVFQSELVCPYDYPVDPHCSAQEAAEEHASTLLIEPRLQRWLQWRLTAILGGAAVQVFLVDYLAERRFGDLQ